MSEKLKILFFMQPVNVFNTSLELRCEAFIKQQLPDWSIENPNRPWHAAGYRQYAAMDDKIGLDYFDEVVLPAMFGGVFLPFRDGMVGAGVWKQCDWLADHGKTVWELNVHSGILVKVDRIHTSRRLDVDATRARIRHPDGSSKPY